ncbi:hypothetical protein D0B54_15465 [Solimonas sp. K1W22B-7]|nr:hypothetical protein D0B54_15465 [Solimonas sp. K1W22B-7]
MSWQSIVGILLLVATVALIAREQFETLEQLDGGLSTTADPWTEADTIRAADGYAQQGLFSNWGLPDLCFGDQFSEYGTKAMLRKGQGAQSWLAAAAVGREISDPISADRFVYTHYPAGPHLIAGAVAKTFGSGRITLYRAAPITAGLIAVVYFFFELAKSMGLFRAALAGMAMTSIPMFTNMMHGLSYQGYALALLLVQLGFCMRIARRGWSGTSIKVWMFLVAFCQGMLGFDYAFLVVLAPLAMAQALGSGPASTKSFLQASAISAVGFGIAHCLHFLQVAVYLGSFRRAVEDFSAIASYRSAGSHYDGGLLIPSRFDIWWGYLTDYSAMPLHFGVPVISILAASFALLLAVKLLRLCDVPRSALVAVPTSALICSAWVIVMHQHSAQHWHFIPRHYFLAVFVALLTILRLDLSVAFARMAREVGRDP